MNVFWGLCAFLVVLYFYPTLIGMLGLGWLLVVIYFFALMLLEY